MVDEDPDPTPESRNGGREGLDPDLEVAIRWSMKASIRLQGQERVVAKTPIRLRGRDRVVDEGLDPTPRSRSVGR